MTTRDDKNNAPKQATRATDQRTAGHDGSAKVVEIALLKLIGTYLGATASNVALLGKSAGPGDFIKVTESDSLAGPLRDHCRRELIEALASLEDRVIAFQITNLRDARIINQNYPDLARYGMQLIAS